MAVPRNRLSNARKNSKRSHHAKTPKQMTKCTNCGNKKLPHTICNDCGFYAGRSVFTVES